MRRSAAGIVMALALALVCVASVSAFPVSLQKSIAEAREASHVAAAHEDTVALQVGEAAKSMASADASTAAPVAPQAHMIPLTNRIRTTQEEEEFFALIDEHHDNLEQGTRQRNTADATQNAELQGPGEGARANTEPKAGRRGER